MGILDEDVERVRDSTDLVALASEHLALKRVGKRFVGLCPFHQEKTPSFSINPEMGLWHCLAGDTGVLTWDGVRPIRELAGTTQKILTERGSWVEAPFFSFGVQALTKITLGRNRVRKVIHATPDHRWFVKDGRGVRTERTTRDLRPGDAMCWSFPRGGAKHVRLSPFGVAHGVTFGDGYRFNEGACVDLHGEKDAELLKWFPLSHSFHYERERPNGDRCSYEKIVDLPSYFKDRPSLDEAPSYLLGWLAGYFAADGCVSLDGTVMLNSANRENLEFVRRVCMRLGIGTYGITEQRRLGKGNALSSLFRIHLINEDLTDDFFLISKHRFRFAGTERQWARRGWVVKGVEETDRVEEVFCAVVVGTHSFTLEDNILTGNCFGCQKSGDAITFVREVEHLDFVGAVERLAARAGVTLRYDSKSAGKDRSRKTRLGEAVGAAIDFYHRLLVEAPEGGAARKYLRGRGFDGDAARRFQLGWAPDDWDRLSRHLQQQKFARDDLVDAGLAFVNRVNRLQDQFRGRLMFPIYDSRGEPAGFGGRALGDEGPKYKNSPDSSIYQKSRLLYGLNWAKNEIVTRGDVVICEGYTDVMAYALAGAPHAVATCGTALADDHFQVLKNLARRVTLAYDADAAGQGAAERWYRWEQQFEIEVRVADLPPGRDPGDLWQSDRPKLLESLERAEPFLQFRIDRVLATADRETVEGRARAAQAAAAIIGEHPNELVRDQYVMQLASALDIQADRLREAVAGVRRGGRRTRARTNQEPEPERPPVAGAHVDRRELDALRWAIHEPDMVADWLHEDLFTDPIAREAFRCLEEASDFDEARAASNDDVRALLERLAVEEPHYDDEPETVRPRLIVNMVVPVAERLKETLLRDDDVSVGELIAQLDAVAHAREVGDWDHAQDVALKLVGWVVHAAREREEQGAE